ncbi:MAG: prolipoprotein diacylglyceryl transferase [bacterium]|nr:prolipoprotein diacylglyceryl transferase [bacterium]
MEFTLLGAVFVAIVPLYLVIRWEAMRGNAASCARNLWDVALGGIVVGVFAGRLTAMVLDGVNPLTNPADILIIRGGVATGAATIAALGTVAWLGRGVVWEVLDGLSAAALAGLGGWHGGCVVRDSCLGTASDLPWAIAQEGSSITRHPVEIYASLLLLGAAVLVALWRARGRPALGLPAGVALLVASGVRLATEPMRPSLGNGPVWWYTIGAVGGMVAIATAIRRAADQPSSETR